MDINAAEPFTLRELQQCKNVVDVAVDAAVGEQAEDMQRRAALPRAVDRGEISLVAEKAAVRDGVRDARQILKHDAARADVRVADLAVADLTRRKSDVQPGGGELGVGPRAPECVQPRGGCLGNGVIRSRRGETEAVHDQKDGGRFFHSSPPSPQLAMIVAKSAGFRLAPPMSPPSMSGMASSSNAFFSFMLPP